MWKALCSTEAGFLLVQRMALAFFDVRSLGETLPLIRRRSVDAEPLIAMVDARHEARKRVA